MTDEHREIIRHLVDEYLPPFESGEVPTMEPNGFFMRFLEQVEKDKILSDDYVVGIESLGGWQALKDLDLIGREKIDVIRVLLTAAIRSSEHLDNYENPDSIWREYAQAGTFTAILRRLDQLEKADRE